MKIVDLVEKFKDRGNKEFNFLLNEIANYVMYEQAMIKKDSESPHSSTIKYRYDEKSYEYINDFISKITFSPKLKIGKGKKVNIKGMPDELYFELKHEMSFSDKIYILDKIKDSFMHLRDDNTMFDFDYKEGCIVIKNIADDFSLECKIPIKALYEFNRKIKRNYDKSAESIKWIDRYLELLKNYPNDKSPSLNLDRRFILRSPRKKYITFKGYNGERLLYYGDYEPKENRMDVKRISRATYESYHTASYVASLVSSVKNSNYPLLDYLYDFNFSCSNEELKNKVISIFNKLEGFYKYAYNNGEYIPYNTLISDLKKLIYSINSQNHGENGLIYDISFVHNMIIKNFIRNARSHANLREEENSTFINNTVIYHDVTHNSYLNGDSEKSIPSFVMSGSKQKFDSLFDEVINNSISNAELFTEMESQYIDGHEDAYEPFLKQLEGFINFAFKLYADDYKITNFNYLNTSVGNASNFVDFLRKILNGTFEYEEGKGIGQR